jgi:hypothetical protein
MVFFRLEDITRTFQFEVPSTEYIECEFSATILKEGRALLDLREMSFIS